MIILITLIIYRNIFRRQASMHISKRSSDFQTGLMFVTQDSPESLSTASSSSNRVDPSEILARSVY